MCNFLPKDWNGMNDTPLESSSQDTHVPFDERSQIPTPRASNLSKAAEVKKVSSLPNEPSTRV